MTRVDKQTTNVQKQLEKRIQITEWRKQWDLLLQLAQILQTYYMKSTELFGQRQCGRLNNLSTDTSGWIKHWLNWVRKYNSIRQWLTLWPTMLHRLARKGKLTEYRCWVSDKVSDFGQPKKGIELYIDLIQSNDG